MPRLLSILLLLFASHAAVAGDPIEIDYDDNTDSRWRRTDPGADGPLDPGQIRPELRSVSFSRWLSSHPASDPFAGSADENANDLFRLDMVIQGLVNPPGPLFDFDNPLSPFEHGPSPLLAVVEINVDRRGGVSGRDTGGTLTNEAAGSFLANVARFGGRPSSSTLAGRTVVRPGDLDSDFLTEPQFERSGAEFVFKLCGCEPLTILSTSVPGDTQFSTGDTWIVQGRLFERTSGFNAISLMTCPPQGYNPRVKVRFSHNVMTDRTTVSLVYAVTQRGAGLLAGLASDPPINSDVGCDGNEGSIVEALTDIRAGAFAAAGGGWWSIDIASRTMSEGWASVTSFADFLDVTDWRANTLIGTTYSRTILYPSTEGAVHVWTDSSAVESGDFDGDGLRNSVDHAMLSSFIAATDSADGTADGVVTTPDFGVEFFMQDLNYDGVVDCHDLADFGGNPCCPADWNQRDNLTVQDLFDFLFDWFGGNADFNGDTQTSLQDLFDYLTAYFGGC